MKTKYIIFSILLLLFFNSPIQSQCFTKITSGSFHIVAEKNDGTLWTWGFGDWGQHGNGSNSNIYIPNNYDTSLNQLNFFEADSHSTFTIRTNNTLWGSGINDFGQMGVGSTNVAILSPTQIQPGTMWKDVSSTNHTYAIQTNGTLWGWGQNDGRQMGSAVTCCSNVLSPVQINPDTDWKQVEASYVRNGIAIKENGTLWGWGTNGGMLGSSGVSTVNFPTQLWPGNDWEYISVGANHLLGLKTNGELWTFGGNANGQAGTGFNQSTARRLGEEYWMYVSAGFQSSYAIKSDGTLWAWGRNDQSQLGDGTTIQRNAPVQIGTDSNWIAVEGGALHAVALKSDGSLWAWGNNQFGQYGNGTTTTSPTPLYIPVEGCTLSISDFQQIPVVIAPNPAKETTTLYFKNTLEKVSLKVYDFAGRILLNQEAEGIKEYQLNTSDYAVGVYMVEVKNNGKLVGSYRLVKE